MKQIIIVEDDPIQIQIFEMALGRKHQVIAYSHPRDLVANIESIDADIFLLDIALPEMDGFQLGEMIRTSERFAETPIIAVSADTSMRTLHQCTELKFNGFIEKPIILEKFLDTVNTYLVSA